MKNYSNSKIEKYVTGLTDFQKEIVLTVREIILSTDSRIKEDIKWGSIAFFNNKNICGFRVAKAHVTLVFMEGASLKDPKKLLQGTGSKSRSYKVSSLDETDSEGLKNLILESLKLDM